MLIRRQMTFRPDMKPHLCNRDKRREEETKAGAALTVCHGAFDGAKPQIERPSGRRRRVAGAGRQGRGEGQAQGNGRPAAVSAGLGLRRRGREDEGVGVRPEWGWRRRMPDS